MRKYMHFMIVLLALTLAVGAIGSGNDYVRSGYVTVNNGASADRSIELEIPEGARHDRCFVTVSQWPYSADSTANVKVQALLVTSGGNPGSSDGRIPDGTTYDVMAAGAADSTYNTKFVFDVPTDSVLMAGLTRTMVLDLDGTTIAGNFILDLDNTTMQSVADTTGLYQAGGTFADTTDFTITSNDSIGVSLSVASSDTINIYEREYAFYAVRWDRVRIIFDSQTTNDTGTKVYYAVHWIYD